MAVHDLKTWPEYFEHVWLGHKRFEVRKNDRDFALGDTLRLMEWNPATAIYTGRIVYAVVSYILRGMGLQDGFVAMSLVEIDRKE